MPAVAKRLPVLLKFNGTQSSILASVITFLMIL